jgi:SAM-dependent methyltransferase
MSSEALAERLFVAGVGAMELCCAYLGVRLGLYRELAEAGPQSAAELAGRAGLDERYVREWLQAQAVAGLVRIDGDDAATARFALADGTSAVLVDDTGPAYLGGLPAALAAVGGVLPRLADAYRTGGPVPLAEYGPDAVVAQAALNRPAYVNSLVAEWLPQLPEVLARLRDKGRPARVGDFACGAGWASIELAKAFPHLCVDGLDNDEASIAAARRNAMDHAVADRVALEVRDLSDESADWSPRYDVVFLFEAVHDFPRPVAALRNARRALLPGGSVIVMDEHAATALTAPGDEVERFFGYAARRLETVPELSFEVRCLAQTAEDRVAAQWLLKGATGLSLPGAEFLWLDRTGVRGVDGYFDRQALAEQFAGLAKLGSAMWLDAGRPEVPGALAVTWIEAPTEQERAEVDELAEQVVGELLRQPGFLSLASITADNRLYTITSWAAPENVRSLRQQAPHQQAVRRVFSAAAWERR